MKSLLASIDDPLEKPSCILEGLRIQRKETGDNTPGNYDSLMHWGRNVDDKASR